MSDLAPISPIGISGLAAYVPPYRVCLEEWSGWTGNNPEKIRAVVGRSFRMRGSEQSVYTLAATAVLRLIRNYEIDPSRRAAVKCLSSSMRAWAGSMP